MLRIIPSEGIEFRNSRDIFFGVLVSLVGSCIYFVKKIYVYIYIFLFYFYFEHRVREREKKSVTLLV